MKRKRLLVLDSNNNFIRSYVVNPSLSHNGDPIGGILGSLQTLQKFVREIKPDLIVVCWDGPDGSARRRAVNKNYKQGRKPPRLNRFTKTNGPSPDDDENRLWQMSRLFSYYECMPIHQFIIEGVEADDLISYVVQEERFADWEKVIVSNDKDFIQLLNEKTLLLRPTQKEVLNVKRVVEKYGIHPNNFVLARAIAGDKSDNLPGVGGAQLKTIAKRIVGIADPTSMTITELVGQAKKKVEEKSKIKFYSSVIEGAQTIQENYSIMQLSTPSFGVQGKEMIRLLLEEKQLLFKKTSLVSMMIRDEIEETGFGDLFQHLTRIQMSLSDDN
jgi:5'-3' exonuclease